MSSDSTGEIYVVVKDQTSPGSTGGESGNAETPTTTSSAAGICWPTAYRILVIVLISVMASCLVL